MTCMYRGWVLKSRDGIPRPITPPPGVDMTEEARTARSRFYPMTVAYTAYALAVATVAFREDGRMAALSIGAGVVAWTLVEYLVHRHVLHGRFPSGRGWLRRQTGLVDRDVANARRVVARKARSVHGTRGVEVDVGVDQV